MICICAMLVFQAKGGAQTLIHYWHFNNYSSGAMYTPTINGIAADFSIHDTSKAKIVYEKQPGISAVYSSYVDSLSAGASDNDTFNQHLSAVPGLMLRVRDPADSMQLLFYIPTVNYHNIVLKYGTESTNNGAQTQNFAYSVDSGATFVTTGLSTTSYSIPTPHVFSLVSVSLPEAVANNSKLVFRVTFANGVGLADSSGNDRFDNVSVQGDSIISSGVAVTATLAPAFTLHPNPVADNVVIEAASEGDKAVVITNTVGQTVYSGTATSKHFEINTNKFATGVYYINIREKSTGNATSLKFVKQ